MTQMEIVICSGPSNSCLTPRRNGDTRPNGIQQLYISEPEGNYTGSTFFSIRVSEAEDQNASDLIYFNVEVEPIEDSPYSKAIHRLSMQFRVLGNTKSSPWTVT